VAEIRALGSVLETDDLGYLVPRASTQRIVSPWAEAVEHLRVALHQYLADRLHSMYVRGSVAAGTAIENVSDLDAIAVVHGDARDIDTSWQRPLWKQMSVRFPFCRGFEVLLLGYDDVLAREGVNRLGFLLATQAAHIDGEDLCLSLPRFRPGPIAVVHAPHLKDEIDEVLHEVAHEDTEDRRDTCGWIMRRIVRTAFEIVMEEEGSWTRDLYVCWEIFGRHEPESSGALREALELAIDPTEDVQQITEVLKGIGTRIAERGSGRYGHLRWDDSDPS
jgi:hypothetical protein